MRAWTIILTAGVCLAFAISIPAQNPPPQAGPMAMKKFDVDSFIAKVDSDKDGSMTKDEWKTAGLVEIPFMLCDSSKDGKITTEEMTACELPEAMDGNKDGVLLVSEMLEFEKRMAAAPQKKYAATSPYVEGGPTGMDFIKLFDGDGDGKVTHMEWEKVKSSTVFKDKHWPEYNKNMDEYITVDEAPKKP